MEQQTTYNANSIAVLEGLEAVSSWSCSSDGT